MERECRASQGPGPPCRLAPAPTLALSPRASPTGCQAGAPVPSAFAQASCSARTHSRGKPLRGGRPAASAFLGSGCCGLGRPHAQHVCPVAEEGHGPGAQASGAVRGSGELVRAQASALGGGAEAAPRQTVRLSWARAGPRSSVMPGTSRLSDAHGCPVLPLPPPPPLKSRLQNRRAQFWSGGRGLGQTSHVADSLSFLSVTAVGAGGSSPMLQAPAWGADQASCPVGCRTYRTREATAAPGSPAGPATCPWRGAG